MDGGGKTNMARAAAVRWLLAGLLAFCSFSVAAQDLPKPLLDLDFDALALGELPSGAQIHTQFKSPDVVPGVRGAAWRTDGFSSFLEAPLSIDPQSGFTLALWVAVESYPSDLEVPVHKLSPASIAQQAAGAEGFNLHIDTFGRWGLRVATVDGPLDVRAPARFPLQKWCHVVATVDPVAGRIALYLNGKVVATRAGAPHFQLKLAGATFKLAQPVADAKILDFHVNRLNAAYDLVAVYPRPFDERQVNSLSGAVPSPHADAVLSLEVPATRFAFDFLRPRVHPIPPANWTNEPHGLVRRGDVWHLFYQRTPNGPFKTQMHWGHLFSPDLVSWKSLPDALWPELQTDDFGFDMKGIWSGNVILDGDKAFAFYTSVNHGDRLAASNPGVAMAVSDDPDLRTWKKYGPILNTRFVRDFRDPFLWKETDTWHMIIGASLDTGGGLDYYILRPRENGGRWERQPRFSDLDYRVMDPGSEIWEMPVFERVGDNAHVLVVNPIGGRISKYGEPATRAVYWTGSWVGGRFHPYFKQPRPVDIVPGHLAPTVARGQDGLLRAIGIVDERRTPKAQEIAGWAHAFSLPRTWYLMPDGQTLGQAPAPELVALRGPSQFEQKEQLVGSVPTTISEGWRAYEFLAELDGKPSPAASSGKLDIDVLASKDGSEFTRLSFDPATGRVAVDVTHAALVNTREGPPEVVGHFDQNAFGRMKKIRVFVDGSMIDVFINDAAAYSVRSYPSQMGSTALRLVHEGAPTTSMSVSLWPLRPAR